MKQPDFYESQKFTQWWLWMVILSTCIIITGISILEIYEQFVKGIPYGNKPMSDTGLVMFSVFSMALSIGLAWLFSTLELEIKIDRYGVHYRYFPIIPSWKTVSPATIKNWEVKKYFTLGYGIRHGLGVKTLNVKGRMGLMLHFTNRRSLRLGTQKPDEIEEAMIALYNRFNEQ
ncbi:MAG: hypothetical protein KF845_12830 [Cyclobacteriaceae bacterium]|nr:hypothetical protein [Cyclobacteriaceae bacterium]